MAHKDNDEIAFGGYVTVIAMYLCSKKESRVPVPKNFDILTSPVGSKSLDLEFMRKTTVYCFSRTLRRRFSYLILSSLIFELRGIGRFLMTR